MDLRSRTLPMRREDDEDSRETEAHRHSEENSFNESLAFQRDGAETTVQFNPVEEIRPSFDFLDVGRDSSPPQGMGTPPMRHYGEERDFETSLRGYMQREEGTSRLTNYREETYRKSTEEDDDLFEKSRGNPFHPPIVNYNAEGRDYFPGRERTFSPVQQQRELQNKFITPVRGKKPDVRPLNRGMLKAERSSTWYLNAHAGFRDDGGFQRQHRDEGNGEHYPTVFPSQRHRNEPLRHGHWPFDPNRIRALEENFEPRPFFPSFSGKQEEWESFWLKFELLSDRYRWSPQKQREQLLLSLKDEALNFAANLTPDIRNNYFMFIQALKERFAHTTPAETVRASLNNIKKSPKESIQEYASRVRTLMAKGYPDIGSTETFNQMTMHHFLQGLPDQAIAYEVLTRRPSNLTEAIDMITWYECCKESTKKKAGLRQVNTYQDPSYVYTYHSADCEENEVRRLNGKKFVTEERLIQFGRDLKMTIENLLKSDKAKTDEQTENTCSTEEKLPQRYERRNIICYSCQEEGHISTRCPYKDDKTNQRSKQRRPNQEHTKKDQSENSKGLSQMALPQPLL